MGKPVPEQSKTSLDLNEPRDKFCNPNNSITEALTHAAFHKPPKHHHIQCITVKHGYVMHG